MSAGIGVGLFGGLFLVVLLISLLVPLGLAIWAGNVASNKGRSGFGWGLLTFVATVCGLLPGILILVLIHVVPPNTGGYR